MILFLENQFATIVPNVFQMNLVFFTNFGRNLFFPVEAQFVLMIETEMFIDLIQNSIQLLWSIITVTIFKEQISNEVYYQLALIRN